MIYLIITIKVFQVMPTIRGRRPYCSFYHPDGRQRDGTGAGRGGGSGATQRARSWNNHGDRGEGVMGRSWDEVVIYTNVLL